MAWTKADMGWGNETESFFCQNKNFSGGKIMEENLIIDGCAFTETEFTGVTQDVLHSKMDAFFLTIPGEGDGYVASTRSIGRIYNMLDNPKYGLMIAKSVADIYKAKEEGKKALILAFQNPNSIENSLEQLRVFMNWA